MNQERNYFKEKMAREASEHQRRAKLLDQMEKEAELARKRNQEDLLNDLTNNTGLSTAEVLARHKMKEDEKSRTQTDGKLFISDFCSSETTDYVSSQLNEPADPLFVYEPLHTDIGGPDVPNRNSVFEMGYLKHVRDSSTRDTGGGYNSLIACERVLSDAFGGLFLKPSSTLSDVI